MTLVKSFKRSRPGLLLLSCLQAVFVLQGSAHPVQIGIIDKIPLLLETGYYSSEQGPGNTIYVLDDTVRISLVLLGSELQTDLVYQLDQPIPIPATVEYRMIGNADSSPWRNLPVLSVHESTVLLGKLAIPVSGTVLLQFRLAGHDTLLQTTRIERPSWRPALLSFFQDQQTDAVRLVRDRNTYIATLLARRKNAPADNRITILPGIPTILLFKNPGLHNDSCIEYRYSSLHQKGDVAWARSDALLSLPGWDGNTYYLLEVRYPHSPEIQSFTIHTSPYWYQRRTTRIITWLSICILAVGGALLMSRQRLKKA